MNPVTVSSEVDEGLLTIDELARGASMTVRTTRYYATLGLLPPPVRRGRMAYYGPEHVARIELIRALQDHGFTLAAIEKYMKRLSDDASIEDVAIQRMMLTSWSPSPVEKLSRKQLEARAGRRLDDGQIDVLVGSMVLTEEEGQFVVRPGFEVGVELLDFDIPVEGVLEAGEAIERHMKALADELTAITRHNLIEPYRRGKQNEESAARLEADVAKLRTLTLQAVVSGFQRAANNVIRRSFADG